VSATEHGTETPADYFSINKSITNRIDFTGDAGAVVVGEYDVTITATMPL
jgi:hypothetical protein